MFKKILFPTDFSDVSKKAVKYIKQLRGLPHHHGFPGEVSAIEAMVTGYLAPGTIGMVALMVCGFIGPLASL